MPDDDDFTFENGKILPYPNKYFEYGSMGKEGMKRN